MLIKLLIFQSGNPFDAFRGGNPFGSGAHIYVVPIPATVDPLTLLSSL